MDKIRSNRQKTKTKQTATTTTTNNKKKKGGGGGYTITFVLQHDSSTHRRFPTHPNQSIAPWVHDYIHTLLYWRTVQTKVHDYIHTLLYWRTVQTKVHDYIHTLLYWRTVQTKVQCSWKKRECSGRMEYPPTKQRNHLYTLRTLADYIRRIDYVTTCEQI